MKSGACLFAIVVMFLGAVNALAQTPFVAPAVDTRFVERPGEKDIAYSIFIPDDYDRKKPTPLVLALHFGGNPEGAGRAVLEILVAQAFSDLGAIIVAPDSAGGSWNTPANEHAIDALLEETFKNYNIDRKRIAVTGFSMGGAGAWWHGFKSPERFSAVIPVAGTPTGTPGQWRLPVFAVHSRDDQTVPIGPTRSYIAELQKRGVNAKMVELSGIAHNQTYRFVDGLRQAVPWLKQVWK